MATIRGEEKQRNEVIQTSRDEKHLGDNRHIENAEDTAMQNAYAVKGDDSDGRVPMTPRRFIAMVILLMSYTGANLPLFFLTGSLSFIAAAVHNTSATGWSATAYGVALAALTPFTGYLQDLVGRRYISIIGVTLLCVGLAIIGSAHSFVQLIFGAVISGLGAGPTELSSIAGLAEIVSVKNRGFILSMMFLFVLPFAPYVLYAQLLAEHATWRWSIWLALIYNGVVLIGLILFYFPKSHHRADGVRRAQLWKEIDLTGGFLSIAGLVLFLVGLQSGGSTYSWQSAKVLAPMIIGIFLILAFIVWEWKGAPYPMVPPSIFKGQRVVGAAIGVAFVVGMNLYAVLNFMPLVFSAVYNPDPTQVGLKSLGFGFGQTIGGIIGNLCMTVFKNRNRDQLLFSTVMMTTFIASLASTTPNNAKTVVTLSTFAGFGVGGVLIPIATVALSATPDAFIATVVALVNSTRIIGGAIGYSIYYAVFSSKLKQKLPVLVATYAIEAGLPAKSATDFVGAFLTAPKTAVTIEGVTPKVLEAAALGSRWAYTESIRYVWYISIPFGVLCIIGCLLMGTNKKFLTNRVAATLE